MLARSAPPLALDAAPGAARRRGVSARRPVVVVTARGRRAPALAARLARSARRLLRGLGLVDAELSILLVSDRQMRAFNRRYRGKDRPTDVLAFAQGEGERGAPAGLLGDVVVSVDTARVQARDYGVTLAREGDRLLVHGLLHLLGYDHERSSVEARRMQRRERVLAGWLGWRRTSAADRRSRTGRRRSRGPGVTPPGLCRPRVIG